VSKLTRLLLGTCLPAVLAAQSPASIQQAVASVTPQDVVRRIGILADDSMLGRATPSPQLEQVARYVAAEFQRFGLKPGGDNGTYLQRYPIERVGIVAESSVVTLQGGVTAEWRFGGDVVKVQGEAPAGPVAGGVLVISGVLPDSGGLDSARVAGTVLVFPGSLRGVQRLLAWRPAAVLIVRQVPDSIWRRLVAEAGSEELRLGTGPGGRGRPTPPLLVVRDSTAAPLFSRAGLTLAAARAPNAPFAAKSLDGVTLRLRIRTRSSERSSAPNTIGILEGSDAALKNEYVFFTGHMDHIGTPGAGEGCQARGGDSICNGADDDASGTTAVIELAQAFSQLIPRPKRSLVFMTVSGEERGLWGSEYFSEHPTVPLAGIVADLNTDMVGRNWKDTIAVIGKEHSDLGATLNRVAAQHPELRMTPIGDIWPEENFYFRSDHYNFARKGVPILFFFNGTHPDYHQVGDEVAKIDGEKESRIIKLDFYLGLAVANNPERPKWNPDSYRRIVEAAR
jgi:peptidase M28-like protein